MRLALQLEDISLTTHPSPLTTTLIIKHLTLNKNHEKGNLEIYLAATFVDSHGSWHHAWRNLVYVTKMKNEE